MQLKQCLLDKGYHLYVDSYYCCPKPCHDLAARGTMVCGTERKNPDWHAMRAVRREPGHRHSRLLPHGFGGSLSLERRKGCFHAVYSALSSSSPYSSQVQTEAKTLGSDRLHQQYGWCASLRSTNLFSKFIDNCASLTPGKM